MNYPRLSKALINLNSDQSNYQHNAQHKTQSAIQNQAPVISIVHIGIGAFHKAHQAFYTHLAMKAPHHRGKWNIAGVSLRSDTVKKQLCPQDCLYTVLQSDGENTQTDVISSIKNVIFAPNNQNEVLALLANDNTKIISLTITEKGYCHDPATGHLNTKNPDIIHDLNNLHAPKTAIGFLVSSLKTRHDNNGTIPTVLCCDNLPKNGNTLAKIVFQFAEQVSATLAQWIKCNVKFPNTMVDRIVPATTPEDIDKLAEQTKYIDQAMVKTEPFSQWIIEDKFSNKRPPWESVGALLVNNVEPFENAKLRLLNGSHSSLAYLGYLCGYHYVHEVVADKDFLKYLKYMMNVEIIPILTPPEGLDLPRYCDDLLTRFSNASLMHKTHQIAMDGSQKLPQRLLHTIEDRLAKNLDIHCLSFAVAGWLRYTMGFDAKGDKIDVQDPFATQLEAIQKQHFTHIDKLVSQYLDFNEVFSKNLQTSVIFKERITQYLGLILANGVPTALKALLIEIESL